MSNNNNMNIKSVSYSQEYFHAFQMFRNSVIHIDIISRTHNSLISIWNGMRYERDAE